VYVEPSPVGNAIFDADLDVDRMMAATQAPVDPRTREEYLHWDKLRRIDPPSGLTPKEWWWKIKFERRGGLRELPLTDSEGNPFAYGLPDLVLKSLRLVDRHCSGEVAMDAVITSERGARQRYLVNSLMEEAIRSSQLEGATTSRRAAKELLRSGRAPRDRSERMIANNFRALQFMRDEIGKRLTPESILELHKIVTDGTLKDPGAAGRLQRPEEPRVAVFDRDDGRPIHQPPPAEQLPERMELLCRFANEGDDADQFIHPVIRAILLHFWLAYDHPFEDGNGRTARILFFWSMRENDYLLVEYLPISKILRDAPAKYARAFMETENDSGDTTYFLVHQLAAIERSIADLHRYLRRKTHEIKEIETLIHGHDGFNHRQLGLLSDALRHPDRNYTMGGHAEIHRITHETARSDLSRLVRDDLLTRRRAGREYIFEPAPDLPKRLKESPA
jgi:Fic family protein